MTRVRITALFLVFLAPAGAQTFERLSGTGLPDVTWAPAWGDYDRDGRLDLAAYSGSGRTELFRNRGDGTFEGVAGAAGISAVGRAHAWADFDGDGWLDLYVVVQNGPNHLYWNNRCGAFLEMAGPAGVAGSADTDFNASWADFNSDGLCDLYVTGIAGARLYRNLGDRSFADVTEETGVRGARDAFAPAWGDYDGNRRADLFLDHVQGADGRSRLFRNRGDGAFDEVGEAAGVSRANFPYGAGWADYDNDGWLDLFVAMQQVERNRLFRNRGNGAFDDVSATSGVRPSGRRSWGGVSWGDYDNDGWIDLAVGDLSGPDQLFRNLGDGRFADRSVEEGIDQTLPGSSLVLADPDGDGRLDLMSSGGGLYANRGAGGHWLAVRAIGNQSTKDALGTRILVTAGGRSFLREIQSGSSYAGQAGIPGLVHFGLGDAATVSRLEVRWPSGETTVLAGLAADREVTVIEAGPGNTRVGRDVRVDLTPSLAVVFSAVRAPGTTELSALQDTPPAPAGYELIPWDPEDAGSLGFRIETTAEVEGSVTLLVRAPAGGDEPALVQWQPDGSGQLLGSSPWCPAPGWLAGSAPGAGLFAVARPALPVSVRIEPEVLERSSFRKDAVVTAFVTLPPQVAPGDVDASAWVLSGARALSQHAAGERLVLKFLRRDLSIESGTEVTLVLSGRTTSGRALSGSDRVRVR
ncbi:MAG: CRTAC1 family protein [Planctomycetes bacterium]|nr:CRTAC1 family protein [Planctomycetota bacterium]